MLYYIALPVAWLLWHLGFRIKVIGLENLRRRSSRGFIIAPTHVSAIDPVFVVIARFWGRRMMVFAKKELFEINPFVTWFIRQCGAVVVRGTRDEVDTINEAVELCRKGGGLLLYPEGTREKDGKILPPKSGVFLVAAQAGVDIVPCRVLYDTPDGRMKLFCRVKVVFGPAMPASRFAMEGRRDVTKLRAGKQALVDAWEAIGAEHAFPARTGGQ